MMRRPDMRTVQVAVASLVALGMLAVPANAALADDFRQDKADYATAVTSLENAAAVLKNTAEASGTLTVASRDDDAATTIARDSLRGQVDKASRVSVVKHEDATVFNMASLTDEVSSSTRLARELSASIAEGARKVNAAVEAHHLRDAKERLADAISNGRKTYGSSDGKVDDTANRDRLSQVMKEAKTLAASSDIEHIGRTTDSLKTLVSKVNADVKARQARLEREAREAARRVRQSYGAISYGSSAGSGGSTSTGGYSTSTGSSSSSSGYSTSASCALDSAADHCQGAVDGGGLVDMNYSGSHIYAQHSNTGGSWINSLQTGQTFTLNGSTYQVNGQSVEGATNAPDSGDWMQTCNGNGNHLVGITKIG